MSSPADHLKWAQRRFRAAALLAAALLILGALWAARPLPPVEVPLVNLDASQPTADNPVEHRAVDPVAFTTLLWNPPPPPAPPPSPDPSPELAARQQATPPRSTPFKLQLLAILREEGPEHGDLYKAALYDPDDDSIHFVTVGERIGSRTIRSVTARTVELSEGATTRTLELDPAGPVGSLLPSSLDESGARVKGGRR